MSATAPHRRQTQPTPPVRDEAAQRPGSRRRLERRVWGVGLLVSALVHFFLFLLASRTTLYVVPRDGALRPSPSHGPRAGDDMHAYNIVVVEDAAEPDRSEERPVELPLETRVPIQRPTPGGPPSGGEPGAGAGEGAATESTVDRLRPRMGDPRLWQRVEPPPPPEKTDIEIARARVYARIQELNDSLAIEADAARRATDWTFTDGDGGKWGISPGKIHLGDLTLPLPFGFSPPPGRREEARDRAIKGGEIKQQTDRQDARENLEQRATEIRQRKDAERKGGGSNSGSGTGGN